MLTIPLPAHLTLLAPWRSMAALALDWILICACFAMAMAWPHPLVYLGAAILIARTQLALAVMMHEAAHGVLANSRRVNDVVGQALAAAPLMLSMFAYRRGHMQHHRAPMASDDPVAIMFGIADYPVSRRQLVWRLFKDLASISYFLSVRDIVMGKHAAAPADPSRPAMAAFFTIASIALANGVIFGVLAAFGHPLLYAGLWLLPALTFLQVFARVRAITEHAGYPAGEDQAENARTVVRRSWQTFLFGPHCIHYHIEHHLNVRVPFYHLRRTHDLLKSQGLLPAGNLYHGYGKVLSDVTF